jgi:anti-sigma factor RsiW
MMRTDKQREQSPEPASDRGLWRRSRNTDVPEDEAARFLDLAGFADGLLEPDEQERVAGWLAEDPEAAADIQAARAFAAGYPQSPRAELERVIARACAIPSETGPAERSVISLADWRSRRVVQGLAQWGSIAAGIALAGWLGYAMGTDTSLALTQPRQALEGVSLPELFDPAPGFLRDLGEGLRT